MGGNNFSIYKGVRPAIVTAIRNVIINGEDTGVFSGFITVKMLDTHDEIDYVKWQNPLMGNTGYGVVTIPVPQQDCVSIGFDLRKRPYVLGMLTFDQANKSTFADQQEFPGEADDPRLNIKPGELMLRGTNKSSILFGNDGSTVFRLDDTKKDTDTSNLIIKIDKDQNITITNGNDINVNCKNADIKVEQKASVTANEVDIVSGNIVLGKETVKAAIIRDIDVVESIDTFGIPIFSVMYLTKSTDVKSS